MVNQFQEVLVSEELILGNKYTKFPGGGLVFGEGTVTALKREFVEELAMEINIVKHIYTADFFVNSKFQPNTQVLAIYYEVESKHPYPIENKPLAVQTVLDDLPSFHWLALADFPIQKLSFETDRKAIQKFITKA